MGDGGGGSIPPRSNALRGRVNRKRKDIVKEVLMHISRLVSIGDACMGAFVSYQSLFGSVSQVAVFLRLALYTAKAVLLMMVGRPHPKVTN